ncbi:MAG: TIGR01777 family oxidoreductase [Angustibacter sp.]
MRIVVSGASGLIGSALVPHLRERGHEVVTLVRRTPTSAREVFWDPAAGRLDPSALAGVEAAVHLSGAGVADHRWTAAYRQAIVRSRVDSTVLLARTLGTLEPLPRALVCASGQDYYRPSTAPVTEQSPAGEGFLADVCRAWEASSEPAESAGITTAHLRTSLVLSRRGGVMGRVGPLTRIGLGGPLGSGRQWWSWITLPDHVAATTLVVEHAAAGGLGGPINLTSPAPAPQKDIMAALAAAARRPSILPVPGFALRAALGEFADTILADRRLLPARLDELGFSFVHSDLESAARWVMSR